VKLARYSVEHFVKTGRRAKLPDGLPAEMLSERAGVFVSLKKHGSLRGCIGTIAPVTASIAEEILRNGVSACSEVPRFDPVRPDELDALVYSVDVLSPAEPIASEKELESGATASLSRRAISGAAPAEPGDRRHRRRAGRHREAEGRHPGGRAGDARAL
jgi:uncharacterized protein (TIGR00296 family)